MGLAPTEPRGSRGKGSGNGAPTRGTPGTAPCPTVRKRQETGPSGGDRFPAPGLPQVPPRAGDGLPGSGDRGPEGGQTPPRPAPGRCPVPARPVGERRARGAGRRQNSWSRHAARRPPEVAASAQGESGGGCSPFPVRHEQPRRGGRQTRSCAAHALLPVGTWRQEWGGRAEPPRCGAVPGVPGMGGGARALAGSEAEPGPPGARGEEEAVPRARPVTHGVAVPREPDRIGQLRGRPRSLGPIFGNPDPAASATTGEFWGAAGQE